MAMSYQYDIWFEILFICLLLYIYSFCFCEFSPLLFFHRVPFYIIIKNYILVYYRSMSLPFQAYHGYVCTSLDAIYLLEACRTDRLPRVKRRLSEKERPLIRAGSIFVWDEQEAGTKRWTGGRA